MCLDYTMEEHLLFQQAKKDFDHQNSRFHHITLIIRPNTYISNKSRTTKNHTSSSSSI